MDKASKRVLMIIGGGVAAYKAPEAIRLLRAHGVFVRVILTAAAKHFVTPLTLESVSGDKVYEDLFSLTDEQAMGHITLSREADLLVVIAATADLLAKMAQGFAHDLASTVLLASDKPVLVAPAMNVRMWHHPATLRNVAQLKADGIGFIGPDEGAMACGEFGLGRMSEPDAIVAAILAKLAAPRALPLVQPLDNRHVVITAGPTHEPIDSVRYIANHSSGKQGFALAEAARNYGATVTLIHGPVSIPVPAGVQAIAVETAQAMYDAVMAALPADIFIAAAAVGDFRMASPLLGKHKKTSDAAQENGASDGSAALTLTLVENPDILKSVATHVSLRPTLVVGFAAETEQLEHFAYQKLLNKGCDMIIANQVGINFEPAHSVFGGEENEVVVLRHDGAEHWPPMAKTLVAEKIIDLCAAYLVHPKEKPVADTLTQSFLPKSAPKTQTIKKSARAANPSEKEIVSSP